MARGKKNTSLNDELSSIDIAKIGLAFNIVGDILAYYSIIKAEEEAKLLEQNTNKNDYY